MSNQTKHTPGPWTVETWTYNKPGRESVPTVVARGSDSAIAEALPLWRDGEDSAAERLANARLISAAPDLLKTARVVAAMSAYECPFCDQDKITLPDGAEHNCSEVPAARAAIAKAEGE